MKEVLTAVLLIASVSLIVYSASKVEYNTIYFDDIATKLCQNRFNAYVSGESDRYWNCYDKDGEIIGEVSKGFVHAIWRDKEKLHILMGVK